MRSAQCPSAGARARCGLRIRTIRDRAQQLSAYLTLDLRRRSFPRKRASVSSSRSKGRDRGHADRACPDRAKPLELVDSGNEAQDLRCDVEGVGFAQGPRTHPITPDLQKSRRV